MSNERARLVYTTDEGRLCPTCGRPVAGCVCRQNRRALPTAGDGVARVRRETKGRGGKTVTTISDLGLDEVRLATLAATLKRRCGCGGSVKDGVIVIQGDHAEFIVAELQKQGFPAKRAGG